MNKKLLASCTLAASILASSVAFAGAQDVVIDQDNQKIISTYGDCVRTKWQSSHDKCTGKVQPNINQRRKSVGKVSRSYLAFFDFNASTLTDSAKNIIASAVNNANSDSNFILTGHADRAGSDAYNIALSKRRASAVKAELNRLGVANSRIETLAKGESTPIISTQDGAREPQNRRVEVVFTK